MKPLNHKRNNLMDLFINKIDAQPEKVLFWKEKMDGSWDSITGKSFLNHISYISHVLQEKQWIEVGTKVAIKMAPCYEWEVVDKAILINGGSILGISSRLSDELQEEALKEHNVDLLITRDEETGELIIQNYQDESKKIYKFDLKERNEKLIVNDDSIEKATVLVATSGTTGKSKILKYTQDQIILSVEAIFQRAKKHIGQNWRTISWLPMDHLTGRIVNYFSVMAGIEIYFVSNPRSIIKNIAKIKPHFFMAVPFFYEKVLEMISQKTIGKMAIKLLSYSLMQKLLIRALWGKEVPLLFSGSAALSQNVREAYEKMNIPIYELYGMSECIIPIAMSVPGENKPGRVGRALNHIYLSRDTDGRLLVQSEGVERNLSTNSERWLESSDIVEIDEEGYIKVLGRCDDIIKTPTGKKVSLNEVEDLYKNFNALEQLVVVSHPKAHTVALISLNESTLKKYEKEFNTSESHGVEFLESQQLNQRLRKHFNSKGDGLPREKRIENFLILKEPLSIDNNEVTLNLKIRRKYIENKYESIINDLILS